VQIQILLLLRELQREFGMSVIFVTHDIGVAIEICDRVAVMYAGQIVEQGTLRDVVRAPVHPYARGLLAATIHGAKRGQRLETIPGTPPSLDKAPHNCSFRAALRPGAAALHRGAAAQCRGRTRPGRALHPGRTRRNCCRHVTVARQSPCHRTPLALRPRHNG
jgi:peptide/nickel transport system ATP-binding protein